MATKNQEDLQTQNARLRAEKKELRAENKELRAEVKRLQKIIDDLTGQIEERKQGSLRQAAPFRIPEKKRKKDGGKRPGPNLTWP